MNASHNRANDTLLIHADGRCHSIEVGHRVCFRRSIRRFCIVAGTSGTIVDWCIATLYVELDEPKRKVVRIDSHFHDAMDFEMAAELTHSVVTGAVSKRHGSQSR